MPYTYGFDADCETMVQWEEETPTYGRSSGVPFIGIIVVPAGWMQRDKAERVEAFKRLRAFEAFNRKSYGDGGYFLPEVVMAGKIALFVSAPDKTADFDRASSDLAGHNAILKADRAEWNELWAEAYGPRG